MLDECKRLLEVLQDDYDYATRLSVGWSPGSDDIPEGWYAHAECKYRGGRFDETEQGYDTMGGAVNQLRRLLVERIDAELARSVARVAKLHANKSSKP
jgi:hypothetical protein